MGFDWEKMFNENRAITEPNANMRYLARANWECYQAHIQEGFTPDQAIAIINNMMTTVILQNGTQPPEDD